MVRKHLFTFKDYQKIFLHFNIFEICILSWVRVLQMIYGILKGDYVDKPGIAIMAAHVVIK